MPRVWIGELMMPDEVYGAGLPLALFMGLGCPGALWWLQGWAFWGHAAS